jgi:hypothetical protein
MVKMPKVNKPSARKLIEFSLTEESIETQLASWVRDSSKVTANWYPRWNAFGVHIGCFKPISLSQMPRRYCGKFNRRLRMRK